MNIIAVSITLAGICYIYRKSINLTFFCPFWYFLACLLCVDSQILFWIDIWSVLTLISCLTNLVLIDSYNLSLSSVTADFTIYSGSSQGVYSLLNQTYILNKICIFGHTEVDYTESGRDAEK